MNNKNISRKKKFLKDFSIYAIGNIGAKLITFLLVPLYTFTISPDEFGYYDICLTVIFFFCPIISLQLSEGAFRFLLETDDTLQKCKIISFVTRSIIRNSAIVIILGITLSFFIDIRYIYLIIAYGLLQSYFDISLQLTRGLSHTKTFMAAGILNAILVAVLTSAALLVFKMGLEGLFYANITARAISLLFIESKVRIIREYFIPKLKDHSINIRLLKYSLPLLPAILIWMVLNGSNVFFIKLYLGIYENGIYAVLAKFSNILYILSLIFYQTWQQNAIEQYHTPDRDLFFSRVFNNYLYLLGGLLITFPLILRINYPWLIGADYQSSSKYLFFNSFYMVVYALATFFDLGYQCAKHTERILPGYILIATIGIGLNIYLTPLMGINGVILSGIITYAVLLSYRAIDTRKYMRISFDRHNYILLAVIAIAGITYHLDLGTIADIVCLIALSALYLIFAPRQFKDIIHARLVKKMPV